VLIGYSSPAFLPAVKLSSTFKSIVYSIHAIRFISDRPVQGKTSHNEPTLNTLNPIVRMPFYSLNIFLFRTFKTAGGKAGLQAAMKNGHSLPKPIQMILSSS